MNFQTHQTHQTSHEAPKLRSPSDIAKTKIANAYIKLLTLKELRAAKS